MNIARSIFRIGCLGALLAAVAAPAFALGDSKVAYVDVENVLTQSKYVRTVVKTAEQRLEVEKLSERRKAIDVKLDEYTQITDELKRKSGVMTDDARKEMEGKSLTLIQEIERERSQLNEAMKTIEQEQMEPVLDEILKVVREVGFDEGYDLVLRGEVVLYASDKADITKKVIARLDAKTPPAAPAAKEPATSGATKEKATDETRSPAVSNADGAPSASPTEPQKGGE
jgi:Skp family chaperone for outer membrane proteins